MTNVCKIDANRANAKASTGPKTARGKTRAAQNALRHGLSLPILERQALSVEARKGLRGSLRARGLPLKLLNMHAA